LGSNVPISQLAEKYQVHPNDTITCLLLGKVERYHRNIYDGCLIPNSFINLEDARKKIAEFVDLLNKRLHSSFFYLTPDDFINNRVADKLEERNIKLQSAQKARYEVKNVC